ncbi:DUF6614 family protein [uncultured Litoreibacter sp.]|uniref:DUF6614 family protein n=1 Tax=uncultured Litoreibacter sp. TaxID=1392394 RepID=UPI00263231E9|nr:DUF6614 family protein [uncultured Litoreibacter sp.]
MNMYHCMIELRSGAKALSFAAAAEDWLNGLKQRQLIENWRLHRRKFGLASGRHSDFILEIEVLGMSQLDQAFLTLGKSVDDDDEQRYIRFHDMIETADIGLYRPYPDPDQRERIALI